MGSWAYHRQFGIDVINFVLSNMYGLTILRRSSLRLGARIMKMVLAKQNRPEVIVWGSGTPIREWLHVDDGEAMVRGLWHHLPLNQLILALLKGFLLRWPS